MPKLLRFLLPLFALVLFHSCDSVERPGRWREDPHAIVPQRNVLLVDFTGPLSDTPQGPPREP